MSAALASLPQVLQNWQDFPTAADGLSFAAGGEQVPGGTQIWKIDLPADEEESRQYIEQASGDLQAAERAVRELPGWFDDLAQEIPAGGQERTLAFSSPASEPAAGELYRWMSAIEQPGQLSFGAPALTASEVAQAASGLQELIDKLSQQVLHLAWVETHQDGRLLARSVIAWHGDAQTGWSDLSPGQMQLHKKNVRLALTSRIILLNLVLTVIRGAGKLGVLLATPGGALLALPAAWRLANQFISEANKYPTNQE
jgi:hypothetical protein